MHTARASSSTSGSRMSTVPSREPDLQRSFQLTDFDRNSNKCWEIEAWNLGGYWVQRTKFARTGHSLQTRTKETSHGKILTLIGQKERKGYKEVELATVAQDGTAITPTGDERADSFVQTILGEADGYIKSYLSVTVDKLSQLQIIKGRELLETIAQLWHANPAIDRALRNTCQEYYMTIPTSLPHRIKPDKVITSLVNDLHEQEERLDQLSAAVRQSLASASGEQIDLGATIESASPDEIARVDSLLSSTFEQDHRSRGVQGRVMEVFKILIPNERTMFDAEETGSALVKELWHGTNARNLRHIMDTGLIIPAHAANGSMLGRGIYFADRSSKSIQYCRGQNMRVVFLADVKVGNMYEAPKADQSFRQPPAGYDSVLGAAGRTNTWGHSSYLAYNEYVVYRASQQTIKYAVVLA